MTSANDNGCKQTDPVIFQATLHHFAEHGLSAPRKAAEFARMAAQRGPGADAERWVTICKALDFRLGRMVEQELSKENLLVRV